MSYTPSCDYGAVFPVSPRTAQEFYRSDLKTIFMYDGSSWKPIESFGDITLYVDTVNGTDAAGKGYASGASACKTLTYAWSLVPSLFGGHVFINVAAGTYTEDVLFQGKYASGPYKIIMTGAMTNLVASTSLSGFTFSFPNGTVKPTITKTGAFTGMSLSGKIIKFTKSGQLDLYCVVYSNTNDTITLTGRQPNQPSNATYDVLNAPNFSGLLDSTWDYEVLDWATTLQGNSTTSGASCMTVLNQHLYVAFMQITGNPSGAAPRPVNSTTYSNLFFMQCRIYGSGSSGSGAYVAMSVIKASTYFYSCVIEGSASSTSGTTYSSTTAQLYLQNGTWVKATAGSIGVRIERSSMAYIGDATIGGQNAALASKGMYALLNGMIYFGGTAQGAASVFIEYATMGVQAELGGVIYHGETSEQVYLNNTSDLSIVGPVSTTRIVSSNTTLDSSYGIVLASGTTTITLPTAVGIIGRQYTIKKTDVAGTSITINTTSSQTIDGATSVVLSNQYAYRSVVSDGANWQVIGQE